MDIEVSPHGHIDMKCCGESPPSAANSSADSNKLETEQEDVANSGMKRSDCKLVNGLLNDEGMCGR